MRVRSYRPEDRLACRRLWVELVEHHRHLFADAGVGGSDPGSGFDAYLAEPARAASWLTELAGEAISTSRSVPSLATPAHSPLPRGWCARRGVASAGTGGMGRTLLVLGAQGPAVPGERPWPGQNGHSSKAAHRLESSIRTIQRSRYS